MDERQQAFLDRIVRWIPRLFDDIAQGNFKSEAPLGERQVGERRVRLKLVVEVIDPGRNPLATHGHGPKASDG